MIHYYNQSVNIPSIEYCYGIAKLLEFLVSNYTISNLEKLIINKNFQDPQSTLIDIHPTLRIQVSKGLIESNSLINTPYQNVNLLYKLERSLSKIVKFNNNDNNIYCNIDPNLKWEFDIANDNINNIYIYTYLARKGYTITEDLGKAYYVTEPLGVRYSIDDYSCSCSDAIMNKKCIHLWIIDWYRQSKLIKNYANYQRTNFTV